MQPQEESLRQQIALGWVMELLLMVIMLEFMTISSIITDVNFKTLRMDPGDAIHWMAYLVAIFALMPIYVHLVHGVRTRILRWLAVAVSVLVFLYFLLHHLAHWAARQRPDLASHVLDLLFHLTALWVIYNSVRWARFPRPAAA